MNGNKWCAGAKDLADWKWYNKNAPYLDDPSSSRRSTEDLMANESVISRRRKDRYNEGAAAWIWKQDTKQPPIRK